MKTLSLNDLTPEGSEFTLRATGKTYKLKPLSLSDEKWLAETFGNRLEAILAEIRMLEVSRMVYHQLEEESKIDFKQQDVKFINEVGIEEVKKVGGYELLFWLISGFKEKHEIYQAFLVTMGVSRELQETLTAEETAKLAEKKSLNLPSQPTGQESLTNSQATTDGPPNTFGQEP